MSTENGCSSSKKGMNFFERYLTLWVVLCIVAGIVLGKVVPGFSQTLDGMALFTNLRFILEQSVNRCMNASRGLAYVPPFASINAESKTPFR